MKEELVAFKMSMVVKLSIGSISVPVTIKAWRTLLVYTAKNLTSFGSYELIKTQIASIFGKKLKFINSFSLSIFFLAVRPK